MKPVIIDTDTLSYFFRNDPNVVMKLDSYLKSYGFVNLSVITYYEVMNGLYYKDAKKQLVKFEKFVNLNQILPLTDLIAKKAAGIFASLTKGGKTVGHNDILIASTAIVNGTTLVTNNEKHFADIPDLDIDKWLHK